MSHEAAHILQMIMPAFLLVFAGSFLALSFLARDLMTPRWATLTFVVGMATLAWDTVHPLSSPWYAFLVPCLFTGMMLSAIKAYAARKGEHIPRESFWIAAVGLFLLSPLWPIGYPDYIWEIGNLALPSLVLIPYAMATFGWRGLDLVDRICVSSVCATVLMPSGGMLRLFLQGAGYSGDTGVDIAMTANYIMHGVVGMTGPVIGSSLLLAVGADSVSRQKKRATTDPLTGVENRYALDELLGRAARGEWRCGAAIIFDLDHFKSVNDALGHAAGDEVLREVGRMLRRSAGEYASIYRLGGEEFLLLLPGHHIEKASSTALGLRRQVVSLDFAPQWPHLQVTASIGLAFSRSGESVEHVIKAADEAMYRAKKAGRNRVVAAGSVVQEEPLGVVA